MKSKYNLDNLLKKPKNLFQDLIQYMNFIEEGWDEKLKPAGEEKIKKLIEVSEIGHTVYHLPKTYIDYLKIMGDEDGGLLNNMFYGHYDIDYLIHCYDDYWENEENEFAFWWCDIEPEPGYYIKFIQDNNYVIDLGENGIRCRYIESFEKFLYRMAFEKFMRSSYYVNSEFNLSYLNNIPNNEEVFSLAQEILEKNNYKRVWFSDKWTYIGIKGESIVEIQLLSDGINGFIQGNELQDLNATTKQLKCLCLNNN